MQYDVVSNCSVDSVVVMSPDTAADGSSSTKTSASASTSSSGRRSSGRPREPLEPLIVAALRSAPGKKMLVTDIYRYIETHSEDYRDVSASQPSSSTSNDTAR